LLINNESIISAGLKPTLTIYSYVALKTYQICSIVMVVHLTVSS